MSPALRRERHFGREVTCYAQRPSDAFAMLVAYGGSRTDAVVDGATRLSHGALHRAAAGLAASLAARGLRPGGRTRSGDPVGPGDPTRPGNPTRPGDPVGPDDRDRPDDRDGPGDRERPGDRDGPGDRVALLMGNRWAFAAAVLAALRSGLIAVPLSARAQAPEVAHMLADSGARLVLHDAALAHLLPEGVDGIDVDAPAFAAMLEAPPAPPTPGGEDDTAVILYTSGTTGRPKGAMLTHLGLVHSALHYRHAFALGPEDRSLMAVPGSHVTGLVANLLTILGAGGTLLILPRFEVPAFVDLARGEGMTHTLMVPAMYELLLRRAALASAGLEGWRVGAYGGAPMPAATIERLARALPDLRLANAYGATETTSPATIMPLGEAGRGASVGRVVPCGTLRVTDEAGRDRPLGEAGEIRIGGPMVVPGYWGNAAAFEGGEWRSGDVGALDAEGYLSVLDRLKDVINRGGYKVWSAEVEGVLAAHEGVAEAAVIGVPCEVLGERVHAVIVPRDGAELDPEGLRAHCAARLSDYKVPEAYAMRSEPLPRNAGGKVLKSQLRGPAPPAARGETARREETT